MGRIKNKILYPDDPNLSLDDYVIGSNINSDGKTQNYPLRSVANLIEGAVIVTVGNESENGIEDGWDLIAEGKPIVADYNDLEFEYNEDMDVVLLKTAHPPLADVKLRSGYNQRPNSDEASDKWSRVYINEGEVEGDDNFTLVVPKLEVSIANFELFNSPRFVIERYRPKRYKGYRDSIANEDKQYCRNGFKKEEKFEGATLKPNDIPITSSKQMIDIGAEMYFRVSRNEDGEVVDIYRTGTGSARKSVKTRKFFDIYQEGNITRTKCMLKVYIEALVKGEYKKVSLDYYLNLSLVGKNFPNGAVINFEYFTEHSYYNVRNLYGE